MLKHEWYTKNEDYPRNNDYSQVKFEQDEDGVTGVLTVICNDIDKEQFEYVGVPTMPTGEALEQVERYPTCPQDRSLVEDLAEAFGVKLTGEDVDAGD